MTLAFLTTEYPHINIGNSGGIGTAIKNLAYAYIRLGHKVFVFVLNQEFENFTDNTVELISITPKPKMFGPLGVYFKNKDSQNQINKFIIKNNIKVIEVPDWAGMAAFMKFSCPMIVKFHGSDAYFCKLEKRNQKIKNYFLEYINIKNANIYISVSDYTSKITCKLFRLDSKSVSVIPNGVEITNLNNNSHQFKNKIGLYKILYFGTLIRKKGCLEIPSIFNELIKVLPEVQLVLAGKDSRDVVTGVSTWELMKKKFVNLTNVTYLSEIKHSNITLLIRDADVCIFPSFAEALPVSWLEAMLMCKTLVASDIGWAKEIIEDTVNGFLVSPKDHLFFAKKIIEILQDTSLNKKLGECARRTIEDKFSIDIIATKHLELFKSYTT